MTRPRRRRSPKINMGMCRNPNEDAEGFSVWVDKNVLYHRVVGVGSPDNDGVFQVALENGVTIYIDMNDRSVGFCSCNMQHLPEAGGKPQ